MSSSSEDTPIRMGKSKKADRLDASRFQVPGINYKGKFIGVEDVPGPRGDKMCHVAMAKLKAAVKTIGEHKLKIIVNISLNGVKIVEEKSENVVYFHPVQRISFISRDPGDSRAFGYVYGREDGSHQFYGIKTEKVAENIVLNLRDLFQIVYELKKQEKEDAKELCIQEGASITSERKSYDSKNGLEQLNVYSSSVTTHSPGQRDASKYDSSATLASYNAVSQSPHTADRMSATPPSRGGFQRGVLSHFASELKRSPLVREQSPLATKQYSSMTAAECRQFYHQQAGSSSALHQLSTSDVVPIDPASTVSRLTKLHINYSSLQSTGWNPVALPPPTSAGTSSASARRAATLPSNGLVPSPLNSSSTGSSEGWAVFDSTVEPFGLSTVVEDGFGAEGQRDSFPVDIDKRLEFQADGRSGEKPFDDFYTTEFGNNLSATTGLDIKKTLSPESSRTGRSSGSVGASGGSIDVLGASACRGGSEDIGLSPKSPSRVPTLASPESLSDEEESSPDASSFPSPNTPPPPLPLDAVVDFTLEPPVPPPRPKAKIVATTRLIESPIYGNLPLASPPTQSSFTLPRPRLSQGDGDRTTKRPRPIQSGYDLTMPRPRPAPNLSGRRPHDDLILIGEQCRSRRPFLRGKTLTTCQSIDVEEIAERNAESASKNSAKLSVVGKSAGKEDGTPFNVECANDPFAICLVSRLSKPQTFVTRSTAAVEDGLIHTSISPIPRPRPRQRSAPITSRDQSSSTSKSVSPLSNKARQKNPSPLSGYGVKRSDRTQTELSRTEQQIIGQRKAEPLSCDTVTRTPEKVHKWSLGSSRSDTAADPFNHVDPFATETFSDDPFSTQPDPLSLESPSSDPFSREFPKTASMFHTRAVTVELGDVFEDAAALVGLADKDCAKMVKTAAEPTSESFPQTCTETDVKRFSESEGLFRNIVETIPSVSGSAGGKTGMVVSTITARGGYLAEAAEISCHSVVKLDSQSSVAGVEFTKPEVISCDAPSTANSETPQVRGNHANLSTSEMRSVLWKSTDDGCKFSSLEVLMMGQNPEPRGKLEGGVPDGESPSDHAGGSEDSFYPVPIMPSV